MGGKGDGGRGGQSAGGPPARHRMPSMLTVGVIPARAGSRGLPGKHLRRLAGEPLIVHTVRAGLGAALIDRLIVTTDDPAVARVARRAGAEVPFLRPHELARDDTPTVPVIEHAVAWLESSGTPVGLVVTLQPTSPLRDSDQVDEAVRLLAGDPEARAAVAVAELGLPASVVGVISDGRFRRAHTTADPRRQASPPAARITGGIYVTRRSLLAEGRLLDDCPLALVVPPESAIDVDTAEDLAQARRLLRAREVSR